MAAVPLTLTLVLVVMIQYEYSIYCVQEPQDCLRPTGSFPPEFSPSAQPAQVSFTTVRRLQDVGHMKRR